MKCIKSLRTHSHSTFLIFTLISNNTNILSNLLFKLVVWILEN